MHRTASCSHPWIWDVSNKPQSKIKEKKTPNLGVFETSTSVCMAVNTEPQVYSAEDIDVQRFHKAQDTCSSKPLQVE